jgi:hypothetical protein
MGFIHRTKKMPSRRATPGQYETHLEFKAKKGKLSQYRKAQASIHRTKKMPPHRATPGEFNHPIV